MTKKRLSARAARELALRRSEAARRAAATRERNRRAAEREEKRRARARSEAAKRAAETRRKNREAEERAARARARKRKEKAKTARRAQPFLSLEKRLAYAFGTFGTPTQREARKKPQKKPKVVELPAPAPVLAPEPKPEPEAAPPFVEPEGLVPPGEFFHYDVPKTRRELFEFARDTKKWKMRGFTNLREIAGFVYADAPDSVTPGKYKRYSFYLILDKGMVYGDWTGGPFRKDYMDRLLESVDADEEYESDDAPSAMIHFHWTFDRAGNVLY